MNNNNEDQLLTWAAIWRKFYNQTWVGKFFIIVGLGLFFSSSILVDGKLPHYPRRRFLGSTLLLSGSPASSASDAAHLPFYFV